MAGNTSFRYVCVIAATIMTAAPLDAQDFPVMDMSDIIGNIAMGSAIEEAARAGSEQKTQKQPPQKMPPRNSSVPILNYNTSPAVRKQTVAAVVGQTRATNPNVAANLERMAASGDIIIKIGNTIMPFGFQRDNVADATSFWAISLWRVANDSDVPMTPAMFAAVKNQMAQTLMASPGFKTADDATKQQFAESMLIQSMIARANVNQPEAKTLQGRNALKIEAIAAGKQVNMDFTTLNLTDRGFEVRTAARGVLQNAPAPKPKAAAPTIPAKPAPAPAPSSSGQAPRVSQVVFTMWSDQQFHPRILFADGTYFEGAEVSMETANLAALKRNQADNWGRWRLAGSGPNATYYFTDSKGVTSDNMMGDGGMYRAFAAGPATNKLNARYRSVTGSSSFAVSTYVSDVISFSADGRFSGRSDVVAIGPEIGGGTNRASSGRYTISGNRIIMTYDNGKVQDLFFAYSSTGAAQTLSKDMIFIGFGTYVTDD